MSVSSESGPGKRRFLLFLLRNIVLYILLVNGYLHFRGNLGLIFPSVVFGAAMLLALFMHVIRLRLPVCFLLFILLIIAVRSVFFLIFRLSIPPNSLSDADFLYFTFDKDFFPSLVPGFITWLFNLLALRYRKFNFIEVGINCLLLLTVFITEIRYNITLYHPTVFALVLTGFILAEIAVLMLHWLGHAAGGKKHRLSPVYFLMILPILLIFFLNYLLMQKYNEQSVKNRGGLMESTLFRFDFSKYIKLESEIKLSDDLVMLLRKNGPAARILIRRFVLSGYEPARGFFQSREKGYDDIPVIVPDSPLDLEDPGYLDREAVEQEYYFINLDPTSLVAMNYPVQILPLKNWDASSFLRIYRVLSQVNQLLPHELWQEDISVMDPVRYQFYTEYDADEDIKILAEQVTYDLDYYTDKVLAIRDFLQENYLYSLKPGLARDGNQLHHFLFESKKGYCSYFAFAMALMCRSIGIPARVAVGFAAVPGWEILNFYEIRANLAHAWVEVYFEDQGWIEFDPTSTNIAEGENLEMLLNFEVSDELKNLISEILENQDSLEVESKETGAPDNTGTLSLEEWMRNFSSFIARTWYYILPLLYSLILCIIKLRSYLLFLVAPGTGSRAKHLYRHSLVYLYGLGWTRREDESPSEYAVRMEAEHRISFCSWTDSYLKAVFAESFTWDDYINHLKLFREFKLSWGKQVKLPLRVLGFFNPVASLRKRNI